MKKNDIIEQKLFETCKLSEFYLNLVVTCKAEDESPMQLAQAYKQKLYEIVERYDRLLDVNRQRQQLTLSLENSNVNTKPAGSMRQLNLINTPNKSLSNLSTPVTSSSSINLFPSNSSSYSSTPVTTPGHSAGKFSTYHKSNYRQHSSHYLQPPNYSIKNLQPYSYLYDDENFSDIDELDNSQNSKSENDDEMPRRRLQYEGFMEDEEEESNKDEQEQSVEQSKAIEKSYSNLSKDSGVFADSYHSEFSNNQTNQNLIQSDDQSGEERISDEDSNEAYEENFTSPVSSASSSTGSSSKHDQGNKFGYSSDFNDSGFNDSPSRSSPESISNSIKNQKRVIALNKRNNFFKASLLKTSMANNLNRGAHNRIADINNNNHLRFKAQCSADENMHSIVAGHGSIQSLLNYNMQSGHMVPPEFCLSSASSSSNVNCDNYNNYEQAHLHDSISDSLDEMQFNKELNDKAKPSPFIFNYNSLMNVSMLDNIQATNTNLEIDNMNSSILMFN